MCSAKRYVRFTPKSGHVRCTSACPLSANSGHWLSRNNHRPQKKIQRRATWSPALKSNKPPCLFTHCRPGRFDFRLHGIEVEARALLHWRELHRSHCELLNLLLHKHEAPEFILEPIEVLLRSDLGPAVGPARTLEWIEAQVDQVGHVRLGFIALPSTRLVDEAILVVVDAHRTKACNARARDYGAGRHTLSKANVSTRYVAATIRILADPNDPKDAAQVNALQDAVKVEQPGGPGKYEVANWDAASHKKVREALVVLGETIPDWRRAAGRRNEVDPIRHFTVTATGWGLNPDKDAIYLNVTPSKNDGKTIYKLNVKDVPVDGFWSISLYNAEGFFEPFEGVATISFNLPERGHCGAIGRIGFVLSTELTLSPGADFGRVCPHRSLASVSALILRSTHQVSSLPA